MVLVIDDDEQVRGLLRRVLEDLDFEVNQVTSVAANTVLARLSYDLVVLDVLHNMEFGLEAVDGLRREGKLTPVIVLGSEPSLREFFRFERVEVLEKPFSLTAIKLAVNKRVPGQVSTFDRKRSLM